ncbi:MAG: thymidine phosphorylase [Clostridiales bacterium]|nr:thymidine phosphorylase [Clostridiales bacterium]
MRMYDIIKHKRDGGELTNEEIDFFINGYVSGKVPDYQVSALLMAIYFNGMTQRETTALTFAIRDSGDKLDTSGISGIRADKHSTGGVGDKTSLVVMPIVASLGVKVAKMSGRGLGHTGGTIDKLESIEGFNVDVSAERFKRIVNDVGLSIVGQSTSLAPADKLLYALRDVTATVDNMPLIASSIMGKKLAADDDCIVLDVKTGSGAFMKTVEDSRRLAELCVEIGKKAGKKISALITDMNVPLGNNIGNSLEVIEAIQTLSGNGPDDLVEICLALAGEILFLCDMGSRNECLSLAKEALDSGKALKTFAAMVEAQGGNKNWIYNTDLFPTAKYAMDVCAPKSGYIAGVDTEGYGQASLLLGAGRNTLSDKIDYAAGIVLKSKPGDYVKAGEVIATLYSNTNNFVNAKEKLIAYTVISDQRPLKRALILDRVE